MTFLNSYYSNNTAFKLERLFQIALSPHNWNCQMKRKILDSLYRLVKGDIVGDKRVVTGTH